MAVFWSSVSPFSRGLPRQQAHQLDESEIGPAA
jgi:hypothetical protein